MALISQKELADHLGLTARQIRNLTDQHVLERSVRDGKGGYPWPESMHRYIAWKVDSEIKRMAPVDLDEARARKVLAEAEMAELDLATRRGEVAEIEDVGEAWDDAVVRARARLLALPAKYAPEMAPEMPPHDAQARLEGFVHEALAELVALGGEIADEADAPAA